MYVYICMNRSLFSLLVYFRVKNMHPWMHHMISHTLHCTFFLRPTCYFWLILDFECLKPSKNWFFYLNCLDLGQKFMIPICKHRNIDLGKIFFFFPNYLFHVYLMHRQHDQVHLIFRFCNFKKYRPTSMALIFHWNGFSMNFNGNGLVPNPPRSRQG